MFMSISTYILFMINGKPFQTIFVHIVVKVDSCGIFTAETAAQLNLLTLRRD